MMLRAVAMEVERAASEDGWEDRYEDWRSDARGVNRNLLFRP